MKENLSEIVFLLDTSGSMKGMEKGMIEGFNSMLRKQKLLEGEARITTDLFSIDDKILYYRRKIALVPEMRESDFVVEGGTALLDAIGSMIAGINEAFEDIEKDEKPEKVMFVIMTDGKENSSVMYTKSIIKQMVIRQREEFGREFIFLGADIDTIEVAKSYGINSNCSCVISFEDFDDNFAVINKAVTTFRKNKQINNNWVKI